MFGKNKKKGKIVKTEEQNKTFNYALNGVTLNFTLRVDIKDQLKDFSTILAQAHKDVLIELGK